VVHLALHGADLDLHVHGGAGADFSAGDPDAARAIAEFHARHGTMGMLAAIVPGPLPRMRKAMTAVAGVLGVLGIHLEVAVPQPGAGRGPRPGLVRPPQAGRRSESSSPGSRGRSKVVTVAPELPGAAELIGEVRAIGAVPPLGHSQATFEEAAAAFERGVRHVTHLGNGMTGLLHRDPGCVGAALLSRASLELILDGIHHHPAFVRLVVGFLRGRGELGRLLLVSDATAPAGMPEGSYRLGDREVRLSGGEVRVPDGTPAGSALTLDQALRNVIQFAGLPLEEAAVLVTANPARVLGVQGELGTLTVGARADLVLLEPDLAVWATIRSGTVTWRWKKDRGFAQASRLGP
jgi:N-acetylglucosamine-6-phosphate deacetylase